MEMDLSSLEDPFEDPFDDHAGYHKLELVISHARPPPK
jgi:hypothetical protein